MSKEIKIEENVSVSSKSEKKKIGRPRKNPEITYRPEEDTVSCKSVK